METTRAGIAIYKINYLSDFILTVVCDVEWETPFCIKFWTGEPSQAYYVGWTGTEYKNCKVVESDPSKLLVLFDDHHLPVGELKMQIVYHTTIEDFPNAIVDEVTNSMKVMAYIDGKNQKIALDFEGEEAAELQFELPAYANEAQRIANEEQRIANEQQRIENEEARIAAETIRQQNEANRIAAETSRVNEYAGLKADVVAATTAANDAATLAIQKAQLAADKAALADAAATLANQKAQLAADKAALADAAATLANQKAEYADAQGDYAKEQGDYAKEQGDTALADHRRAESDHETAASDHTIAANDHTQAGNDHTRAESDHSTAADDHTLAASDHSTAANDHTLAASDHSTAADDHTLAASDHSTSADDHTQAGNDHTRAESDHTRAESDHAAVEVYVDSLGAFDISSYHATGGVLTKYADLTAALGTNGANIPEAIRKGGMSVKFVHSSDNIYVQFRYMSSSTAVADFTNVANWQGVDDKPIAGSKNLVESDGIKKSIIKLQESETIDVTVTSGRGISSYDVVAGETYIVKLLSLGGLNGAYVYSGNGSPYTQLTVNAEVEWTPSYNGFLKIYNPATGSGEPEIMVVPKEAIVEPLNELFGNIETFNLFPTVNALHKSFLPFNGKISIIGDSISTFTGTMPSGYVTYYPTGNVTSKQDMWWDLIMSLTQSTLDTNASWSGSRVTNGRSGEGMPDFYDRTSILGTPDYIFVALGTNDSTNNITLGDYDFNSSIADLSETEFIPAYTKGVKSLLANYPSSKVVLYIFQMQEKYADAIRTIGNYYNIPVIDARAYYIDNVHPNKEGMTVIAKSITSFYLKGIVDKVPVAGSHNTVESNGVKKCILKIEEKETVTATVSSGRGVTNYSVFANIPYKIKLTNFGGLGNAFVYTGNDSPYIYTQLFLNVEIEWTPSCDGYVKIYNPSSQNGTPVFDIEPKDSIIPKVDNLLEVTEKLSEEKVDKDTIFSSARTFDDWTIGDINGNTGADVASTTVIRTQNYHKFEGIFKIVVTPNNNYKCGYRMYSKSGDTYTLVGGSTAATTEQFSIIVNPDYYYRFLVLYAPGGQTANVNWANNVEFFFKLKTDLADLHIPFVNVKDFGAAGDGTTDDVSSIMLAVASCAETGGTIYFPAGVYALKTLSGNNHFLEIYSNQKFLLDKGAVIKRMTSTEGHLIRVHNASGDGGYNGSHDVEISGGTLDINGYDETNNPDGYDGFCNAITTSHCTNAIISNCVFKNQTVLGHGIGDSSWHYIEVNSSKNVFINNCFFELSNCSESIQIDSAVGHGNEGLNDNTPCKDIAISGCIFVNNGCVSVGNHDANAHSNIRITKCVFEGTPDSSRSYIDFQPACHSIDVYENTFRNGNKGVSIQNVTDNDSTVHDNRFESVTTPHTGGVIAYNNIVNGSLVS